MEIRFAKEPNNKGNALVLLCFKGKKLSAFGAAIDKTSNKALSQALKDSPFEGKKGESLTLYALKNVKHPKIILFGLGDAKEFTLKNVQELGGMLFNEIKNTGNKEASVIIDIGKIGALQEEIIAANMAHGFLLRSWRFFKYYTVKGKAPKITLERSTFITNKQKEAETVYRKLEKISSGVFLTRELVSEPPNVMYPEVLAKRIEQELKPLGVKVEIFNEEQLKKMGATAILAVGQGSIRSPRLVVMQWQGGSKTQKPVAFVGKGVTFDTGGISIKPSEGMDSMKYDMAGAGTVAGLMKVLAGRKAKVNAVGVVALVENMPSGAAYRPGDVVKTLSGQTIEVLNTDAEGRVILSDALWYTQNRFKPQAMVDLATLTGAMVIALGDQFAGLFPNNDALADKLKKAGEKTGERVWPMPMDNAFDKDIDSVIADVRNTCISRKAGSITAAKFLERFVNKVPWAHLDIAGMAWADKSLPLVEKGATAFGVRLLNTFVEDYFEK
ncbi:leucyl aminopeptidase [Candidatus Nucleicultrix amoebiphila]|jgi:leucyl aminopeptidase|uniref:Probable cytosol aminopeptidase n=1 Tax=Candidatus Nucleicultrix amoebiphila FS5 TaxID=1414854 RepID=A0A1W6N638_9PROT|nr:leucyl aminopeptidase [Candidatus Nucleicultrix amoebiphila]ARN85301.1 aminopeptidase A [Candidatus Nucleicultrix amoebiphila FS5]